MEDKEHEVSLNAIKAVKTRYDYFVLSIK